MNKVLVDPAALEEAAKWLEIHSSSSGSAEAFVADALREAIAQTAEAEGVEVVAYADPKAFENFKTLGSKGGAHGHEWMWAKPDAGLVGMVREDAHLAALSAVTAERDRLLHSQQVLMQSRNAHRDERDRLRTEVEALRKDAERWRYVSLQGDDTHWLNLLRVDLEDFGGNINAAVDALIDGEAPAMAAKEA